jgi:hypothetical protein
MEKIAGRVTNEVTEPIDRIRARLTELSERLAETGTTTVPKHGAR